MNFSHCNQNSYKQMNAHNELDPIILHKHHSLHIMLQHDQLHMYHYLSNLLIDFYKLKFHQFQYCYANNLMAKRVDF